MFVLTWCAGISEEIQIQIDEWLDLYTVWEFEEASVLFDGLVEEKNVPDEVWYYKATVEIGRGDIITAKNDINTFLQLQPNHIEWKVTQAYIFNLLKENESALKLLQDVLIEEPSNELAQTYIAMLHIQNADYILAEPFLLNLIDEFPENPEYPYILGSMYSDRGFESDEQEYTDKALSYLYTSYQKDKSNPNTTLYLWISLIDADQFEDAAKVLAILIQNDPGNWLSRTHLWVSLSRLWRNNQAEVALNKALELEPSSVLASNELQKLGRKVEQIVYVTQSARFMTELEKAGRGIENIWITPMLDF